MSSECKNFNLQWNPKVATLMKRGGRRRRKEEDREWKWIRRVKGGYVFDQVRLIFSFWTTFLTKWGAKPKRQHFGSLQRGNFVTHQIVGDDSSPESCLGTIIVPGAVSEGLQWYN
ncbi:uncharacterized protein DS421_2g54240 [Arachis hypogaea]|nr:uncharacterized protein DS421_2g54240 [Arachis hypogaea]